MAVLVAQQLYSTEARLWWAEVTGLLPDRELISSLENGRQELEQFLETSKKRVSEDLDRVAHNPSQIDAAMDRVQADLAEKKDSRRSLSQRTLALVTGGDYSRDIELEIQVQLLEAELAALRRLRDKVSSLEVAFRDASEGFEEARREILSINAALQRQQRALVQFQNANPILHRLPGTTEWAQANHLLRVVAILADQGQKAAKDYWTAKKQLERAQHPSTAQETLLETAGDTALQPLTDLLAARQAALAEAEKRLAQIAKAAKDVFWTAVLVVVGLTLAPFLIKLFWYYVAAPAASRRKPICLLPATEGALQVDGRQISQDGSRPRVSAVSEVLSIDEDHELLVHPQYLQSSSGAGHKDTKWLLDWRFPLTSLAAGLFGLTRIRGSKAESYVISSTRDPFSEIGVISVPAGSALTLQPRSLVGLIQPRAKPLRISRQWRLDHLGAWLTLQLRFLIFHGPAVLIVQGCRGIRVEGANHDRAIDRASTIGFTANLKYTVTRSETFGAYLLGERGLFNDHFSGGPGFYVYEEMPYLGKKSGTTGRGLEGVTDIFLKAFGI